MRFGRKIMRSQAPCSISRAHRASSDPQFAKEGVPGVVISIQTFGDLVNFHPHLHCLVSDGCFT